MLNRLKLYSVISGALLLAAAIFTAWKIEKQVFYLIPQKIKERATQKLFLNDHSFFPAPAQPFMAQGSPHPSLAMAQEPQTKIKDEIAQNFLKNEKPFLTCSSLRARVKDFLQAHYLFKAFDENISRRVFLKWIQELDPGKNFFLQNDIQSFKIYENHLGQKVARTDCRFIHDQYSVFLERLSQSKQIILSLLNSEPDFSLPEFMESDRKKLEWVSSEQELQERWRQQIKFYALGMKETGESWNKIKERLTKKFHMMDKNLRERNLDDIYGMFLNAFAQSLDPHSAFMGPIDTDEFNTQFSLKFVGIGATLNQIDGVTIVDALIPGGAAMRDGRLMKGDRIVAVDSGLGQGFVDVIDLDLSKVVNLIRGKKDTLVTLSILRKVPGSDSMKREIFQMRRDVVFLEDSQAKSDVLAVGNKKIGVINLPSFYIDYEGARKNVQNFRSSAKDVKREIDKLKNEGVHGVILDLRENGGGDLGECVKLTGLFIEKGSVVQVESRDKDVESYNDEDESVSYSGPMAVLISKQSASASEIISGALQDYGRAIIIGGLQSYGKATVQNILDIPGTFGRETDGSLRVTISKFFRPSGQSNQERGVLSDIVIPNLADTSDYSERENEYVLPHSTINPSKYFKKLRNLQNTFPELIVKSQNRTKNLPEFLKLKESFEKTQKDKSKTQVSLKLSSLSGSVNEIKAQPEPTESGRKIVKASDIQLKEAAQIVLDASEILGVNWASMKK
jgi:carboxyl-terminal processing protease